MRKEGRKAIRLDEKGSIQIVRTAAGAKEKMIKLLRQ